MFFPISFSFYLTIFLKVKHRRATIHFWRTKLQPLLGSSISLEILAVVFSLHVKIDDTPKASLFLSLFLSYFIFLRAVHQQQCRRRCRSISPARFAHFTIAWQWIPRRFARSSLSFAFFSFLLGLPLLNTLCGIYDTHTPNSKMDVSIYHRHALVVSK